MYYRIRTFFFPIPVVFLTVGKRVLGRIPGGVPVLLAWLILRAVVAVGIRRRRPWRRWRRPFSRWRHRPLQLGILDRLEDKRLQVVVAHVRHPLLHQEFCDQLREHPLQLGLLVRRRRQLGRLQGTLLGRGAEEASQVVKGNADSTLLGVVQEAWNSARWPKM